MVFFQHLTRRGEKRNLQPPDAGFTLKANREGVFMDFEPVDLNRNYYYFELIRRWEYLLLRDREYVIELIDAFCMVKEGIGLDIVIGDRFEGLKATDLRKNLTNCIGITGNSIHRIEYLLIVKKTPAMERAKELELFLESIRKRGFESETPTYVMELHQPWWVQGLREFTPQPSASERPPTQTSIAPEPKPISTDIESQKAWIVWYITEYKKRSMDEEFERGFKADMKKAANKYGISGSVINDRWSEMELKGFNTRKNMKN